MEINKDNIPIKKALFTCNHVLNENYLTSKNKIEIKNKSSINHINLKKSELYTLEHYKKEENNLNKRKIITDTFLDYTCIELFDNDFDNNIELFDIYKDELKINKDIFILQHPKGEDILSYSLGQILKIQNSIIYHLASTEQGSSGSPLLNREDFSVIGIHFGGVKNNFNVARDIKSIIDDINLKILNINKMSNIIKKLKEDKILNMNNNEYLKKEQMYWGELGVIYKSKNLQNKEVLIISINLFRYYENHNNKEENIIITEIKDIINNIKRSNQQFYGIYIEENSINIVIEKYENTFENYFKEKNSTLNFNEIKSFINQINQYIKIYKDLNINLNYISFKNILVKKENEMNDNDNDENIKYQFLFYYNKIILDKKQMLKSPELKKEMKDYSKSDLWDIGILLYYISMKGNFPFNNYSKIEEDINNGILYDSLKGNILSDLIEKLLKYKKDERIEWKDYFNYKFSNINIPKKLDILGKNRNPISKNEIDILYKKVLSLCSIE